MLKERLLALIEGFGDRRVLVVGDIIADEFIYGEVARVSREAPVLILKYDATEMVAGGAGNAANNVAALGGRARLAGLVGRDAEGRRLMTGLPRGVERSHIVRAPAVPDAGEDENPRRRRSLRQTTGGAHRPRNGVAAVGRRQPGVCRQAVVGAGGLRCRRAVRLRLRADYARPRADDPPRARAARRRRRADPGRFPLPAVRVPGHDDVHAERVGSRAAPRHPHRR